MFFLVRDFSKYCFRSNNYTGVEQEFLDDPQKHSYMVGVSLKMNSPSIITDVVADYHLRIGHQPSHMCYEKYLKYKVNYTSKIRVSDEWNFCTFLS